MQETLVIACFQIIVTGYFAMASGLKGPAIDLLKIFMLACLLQVLCKLGLTFVEDGSFLLFEFVQPFNLLFGPLLYLSYRADISGKGPVPRDLLHVLPFIFFLPFSLRAFSAYLRTGNETIINEYSWWNYAGLTLSFTIYGGLICFHFFRNSGERASKRSVHSNMYARLGAVLWLFALPTVILYFGFRYMVAVNLWGYACLVSAFLVILYHFFLLENKPERFLQPDKYHKSRLERSSMERILTDLDALFIESRIFLEEDLSLGKVASQIGHPAHHITQSLSRVRGQHFNEYVNDYRIREFLKMIETGKGENIRSLYILCGFKSRSTFHRAFNRNIGMTPSAYLASRGKV